MSRFTRISSALIRSGIPLLQVLDMSSKTAGNVIVGAALLSIKKSVNEGKPMNEAMRSNKLFPPIVTQMVAIGESTGRLEQLLLHISDYYDAQVDHSLKNLTTTIEPVLIFCLGGMVLLMALGIFLPMWNMIQVFKR
jgi:MSHA biogenesis protein MshG